MALPIGKAPQRRAFGSLAIAGDKELQLVPATRKVVSRSHAGDPAEDAVELRIAAEPSGQRRVEQIAVPGLNQTEEVTETGARAVLDEADAQVAAEAAGEEPLADAEVGRQAPPVEQRRGQKQARCQLGQR